MVANSAIASGSVCGMTACDLPHIALLLRKGHCDEERGFSLALLSIGRKTFVCRNTKAQGGLGALKMSWFALQRRGRSDDFGQYLLESLRSAGVQLNNFDVFQAFGKRAAFNPIQKATNKRKERLSLIQTIARAVNRRA